MTAAHCTADFQDGYAIDVYTGAQANPVSVGGGTKNQVDRYVQHPGYDSQTMDNDISLLHLSAPLSWKSSVSEKRVNEIEEVLFYNFMLCIRFPQRVCPSA